MLVPGSPTWKGTRNMHSQSGRTSIEIIIMAAILVVIVVASVNSASLIREIKCTAPYVGSLCKALAAQ